MQTCHICECGWKKEEEKEEEKVGKKKKKDTRMKEGKQKCARFLPVYACKHTPVWYVLHD